MWNSLKARIVSFMESVKSAHTRATTFVLASTLMPTLVMAAQATGVSGLFINLGTTARNFISLISIIAVALGVAAVLYGIVMMIKKGTGQGDQIEWREILWPLIGGAMATVLMFMVFSLVAEVGAGTGDMGEGWGGPAAAPQ